MRRRWYSLLQIHTQLPIGTMHKLCIVKTSGLASHHADVPRPIQKFPMRKWYPKQQDALRSSNPSVVGKGLSHGIFNRITVFPQLESTSRIWNYVPLQFYTALYPPYPHCAVTRARDNITAIRGECNRVNRSLVSDQWFSLLLPSRYIPDTHCRVARARGNALTVWGE